MRRSYVAPLLLIAGALAGCDTALFVAPQAGGSLARLSIAHSVATANAAEDAAWAQVDRVRVRLAGAGVNVDETVVLTPGQDRVSLQLELAAGQRQYQLDVRLQRGDDVLFRDVREVTLASGETTPVEVSMEPVAARIELPLELPAFSGVGDTMTVPVRVLFATGDVIARDVVWSSSDTKVVEVDAAGRVTTRGPGAARIHARFGETEASTAVRVRIPPVPEHALAAGIRHSCVLNEDGAAFCWGDNSAGQLGNGTNTSSANPVAVAGNLVFTQISAGGLSTCALTWDAVAYCWGAGALGVGVGANAPVDVSAGLRFTSLSVSGSTYACGIATDGRAYCRGGNAQGQLGRGDTVSVSTPAPVSGSIEFRSISAGLLHTCGLDMDGRAHCWGWNADSQTGSGIVMARVLLPAPVTGGQLFSSISAGPVTPCGATAGGAYCWGSNYFGVIGAGHTEMTEHEAPVPVAGGIAFASVILGNENYIFTPACGLTVAGDAFCWGANIAGQLGTTAPLETCTPNQNPFACIGQPVPVAGSLSFATLAVGGQHACGITADRRIFCWGGNPFGQLGTGGTTGSATPVQVAGGIRP
jgi:alpha-tubulin suppressor-like RCC1 family protein